MKVLVYTVDAAGHFNAAIGLAQALAKRGHQVIFIEPEKLAGTFAKFGFKEILLTSNHDVNSKLNDDVDPVQAWSEMLKKLGLLSGRSAVEKITMFEAIYEELYNKSVEYNPQVEEAIQRERPDLIVCDHLIQLPAIVFSGVPWTRNWSGNPLMAWESPDLPPATLGLPIDDRTNWKEHGTVYEKTFKQMSIRVQNRLFEHFNYPKSSHTTMLLTSPYINIYGYPEELNYTKLATLPPNSFVIDAFCRTIPEPFDFPEDFKQKIKPGDKLIYLSMGSMGSIDIDLMKKIVNAMANTSHKCIVSKGPLHDHYELPSNMWGEAFLPQTNILPLVDLVITHGGNNTVTESFLFGKPMIVMPLFIDQFDNAQRIYERGFGIRLDPYHFEAHQLIEAIDRLLADEQLRVRLQQASRRIAQSNSKERLCAKLEEIVNDSTKNSCNSH